MARYVKAILYTAVAVWAVVLFVSGQSISSPLLRPFSMVTSIVVLLSIAFEVWLWKLPLLHGWFVRRPVIEGTWHAELHSNWINPNGAATPPIKAYAVIRQTLFSLSLRLMTPESASQLVGTEIVCSADGQYCVSSVYRNEPQLSHRSHSPIHYGAILLRVIQTPTKKLEGHYWTDRQTAGEMILTDRCKKKFQDFASARAHMP